LRTNHSADSTKGFTLIELLVVISIIAVLMSILMPALGKAKSQVKAVLCRSNLRQWGFVLKFYTEDNNGFFMEELGLSRPWLKEYYKNDKLLLCPMATKSYDKGGRCPFAAHYYYDGLSSYGHNSWLCSRVAAQRQSEDKLWKKPTDKAPFRIPMVFDCAGYQNANPWPTDEPPEYPGQFVQGTSYNEMRYVCINRHNGYINMVFMDYSVRKVGLKELWNLRWHRKWDEELAQAGLPVWPKWMENLPE